MGCPIWDDERLGEATEKSGMAANKREWQEESTVQERICTFVRVRQQRRTQSRPDPRPSGAQDSCARPQLAGASKSQHRQHGDVPQVLRDPASKAEPGEGAKTTSLQSSMADNDQCSSQSLFRRRWCPHGWFAFAGRVRNLLGPVRRDEVLSSHLPAVRGNSHDKTRNQRPKSISWYPSKPRTPCHPLHAAFGRDSPQCSQLQHCVTGVTVTGVTCTDDKVSVCTRIVVAKRDGLFELKTAMELWKSQLWASSSRTKTANIPCFPP